MRSENMKVEYPIVLDNGDYIRAQVANASLTNIVVTDLTILVK